MPLACSKHGSRALDALWASGNPAHRTFIAEALAPHQQHLKNHFFGKFAVHNFALPLFIKKRADWIAYVKREANKRKMFADLLPTTPGRWQGSLRSVRRDGESQRCFLPAIEHTESGRLFWFGAVAAFAPCASLSPPARQLWIAGRIRHSAEIDSHTLGFARDGRLNVRRHCARGWVRGGGG